MHFPYAHMHFLFRFTHRCIRSVEYMYKWWYTIPYHVCMCNILRVHACLMPFWFHLPCRAEREYDQLAPGLAHKRKELVKFLFVFLKRQLPGRGSLGLVACSHGGKKSDAYCSNWRWFELLTGKKRKLHAVYRVWKGETYARSGDPPRGVPGAWDVTVTRLLTPSPILVFTL